MLHLIRREYAMALVFVAFGVLFTYRAYPQLRVIQILLPFACGLATGIVLARGLWLHRV